MIKSRTALVVLAISCLEACSSGPDPERVRALLIVVPGAHDVESTPQTVSYKVSEAYPAAATLKAIGETLAGRQCRQQEQDPFNAEPVFTVNRWVEHTLEDGGRPTVTWSSAWLCQPSGDVVMFALQSTRETSAGASTDVKAVYYSPKQFGTLQRLVADPDNAGIAMSGGNLATQVRHTQLQTCAVCGSTRKKVDDGAWKVLYDNPNTATHEHQWHDGVTTGAPVRDGAVILVRRRLTLDDPSYTYGAFVLEHERIDPKEQTDYKWILRTDGGSVLDPSLATVRTGYAKDRNRVTFGSLRMSWSGGEPGRGYVYYPRFAGSSRSSEDWELCITELPSFERLDAADPRFVYKSSPGD